MSISELTTLRELRAKAEQGDAQAQRDLGLCYAQGKGVAQNHAQAVAWFQKAVEQGDPQALCNLGFCYAQGKGVPKDLDLALVWYGQAAESSNPEAVNIAKTAQEKIGLQIAEEYMAKVKENVKSWSKPNKEPLGGGNKKPLQMLLLRYSLIHEE